MTSPKEFENQSNISHFQQLMSLTVAQIKCLLEDGSDSITELTDSFIHIAGTLENTLSSRNLDEQTGMMLQEAHKSINQGIVAFQFYDRISQKLDHICSNLDSISDAVADKDLRSNAMFWLELKELIKQRTTMMSETMVVEKILSGDSVEETLKAYLEYQRSHHHKTEEGAENDVELF